MLKPDALLYTITDVPDLHQWHVDKCDAHPMFIRIPDEEIMDDPCVRAMTDDTEESKKVARLKGKKFFAVYRRLREEELGEAPISALFKSDTSS